MSILRDIKFVFRLFLKYPGSSLLGVLVLGLGLGMSITMFAMVNGVLWSTPGLGNYSRLVQLKWANQHRELADFSFNHPETETIIERAKYQDTIAYYRFRLAALYNPGSEELTRSVHLASVSPDFFNLVTVKPLYGRTIDASDFERGRGKLVVVISYSMWQTYFAGLPNAIGAQVRMDGALYTVIGVMPQGFHFPINEQLWVPSRLNPKSRVYTTHIVASLGQNMSIGQIEAELEPIAFDLSKKHSQSKQGYNKIRVLPYGESLLQSELAAILFFLSIISLLVFIVTCANVSNLLMMRVSRRQQELVIRKTLGASHGHIVMQVMLEGLLFACGGLLAGLLLYRFSNQWIWDWIEQNLDAIPQWWHMQLDWKVYLFAILVVILSAVVSSIAPAIRAITKQSDAILKDDIRTASGLFIGKISKLLVSIQVTCATVLSVMALMMILVAHYLNDWDLPYDSDQILTTRVLLNNRAGFKSNESILSFCDAVSRELKALPGVHGVGFSTRYVGYDTERREIEFETHQLKVKKSKYFADSYVVSRSFFKVFGIKPVKGRLFLEKDSMPAEKVAVVNQYFVNVYFGDDNPLGQRVKIHRPGNLQSLSASTTDWLTIVGVVSNAQRKPVPGETAVDFASIYIPQTQYVERGLSVFLRAEGDLERWVEPMRRTVHKHAPMLAPRMGFISLTDLIISAKNYQHMLSKVVIVFGFIALFITAVGLYALIAFTATLQRRELGIRSALGADSTDIISLMFKRAVWLLVIGLVTGATIAITITDGLQKNLEAIDLPVALPSQFVGVGIVIVIGLTAFIIPALQALRVSPCDSLRVD